MSPVVLANPRRTHLMTTPVGRGSDAGGTVNSSPAIDSARPDGAPLDDGPLDAPLDEVPMPRNSARTLALRIVAALLVAAFGLILWGGYTQGWDWTGVSDKDTLWHWMQILMVPIAFAALPGVLRDHQAMHDGRKLLLLLSVVLFVGFVIVSYVLPLDWTGFTGNTLWDWLTLLLLPIAITSVRFLRTERTLTLAHYGSAAVLLAGFGVLVFFGYIAPWDWTGFTGNTFLDWVQLLILPVLFPTVVVPAAAAWLTAKRDGAG